ncbi:MAG: N-acetylmuramoyl-L-alanine amidase [Cryomorphaceae bacterium]|nr:N-acetylmuramoyl-L-alanine amidase [Cryomorphaceae bacterium]
MRSPIRKILFTIIACLVVAPGFNFMPSSNKGVKKVVIDAGHGGKDPGNLGTGRYKKREKDVALAVSKKLGAYIKEHLPDVEVIYTRETDKFVELHERAAIANRNKADLFISIHCDAFTNPQAFGSSTYVMGKGQSDKKMRVAIQENAVIKLEDNFEEKYEGFDPNRPETYIALSLYQNAFLQQSVGFAQEVQDQFRERAKRKDRGVKQQPLVVTSRTAMPAVLIELGFLTNYNEEDYLQSENGQNILASAIFRAFRSYKTKIEQVDAAHFDNVEITSKPIVASEDEEDENEEPVVNEAETPDKKANEKVVNPAGVPFYYAVQILVSGKELEVNEENFSGLNSIHKEQIGRLHKFYHGIFPTHSEAKDALVTCKNAGFTDAFIVAFDGGKRIDLETAKRKEKSMGK